MGVGVVKYLIKAGEALAMPFGVVLTDYLGEIRSLEKSQDLTEYGCVLNHFFRRLRSGWEKYLYPFILYSFSGVLKKTILDRREF